MGVARGRDFRTAELPAWIKPREGGVIVALHVQPGARRSAVIGLHGDRLKVAVASPPAEGRANAALLEFLAERLALPKSRLTLLSGTTSREKRIAVETPLPPLSIAQALLPA